VNRLRLTAAFLLLAGIAALRPGDLVAQLPPAVNITSLTYPQQADRLADVRWAFARYVPRRDPCLPEELQTSWIDWLQRKVSRTVCGSAMWFDGLFGESGLYEEIDATYGRIFLGLWWDERDGFDAKFRFRMRLALPQLENRVNLVIGRESVEDFITDQHDAGEGLAGSFADAEQEEWLLGIGFVPARGRRNRFTFDAGVRMTIPVDPYLRVHYRLNLFTDPERIQVRLRETVFWRKSEGFGFTSRADIDRSLGQKFLIRATVSGTVGEVKLGIDWYSSLTLYQYLGAGSAIAYLVEAYGETEREVPLENYGVLLTYRRSFLRPWLFIELSSGLYWPRRFFSEQRKINPGLGLGFELYYGSGRRR
jgi:hypothetical protein